MLLCFLAPSYLSPHGIAKLQAEFLQALNLRNVALVGNDLGAFQLTAGLYPERIARLVLTPCEAFENFPPGLPGRTAEVGIKMPGGAFLLAQLLRVHALRRLPLTFGWMAKRPIPNEMVDAWLRPLQTQRGVRRDLTKFVRTLDHGDMLAAAERLRSFERPALVIWAKEDRVMPPSHGRRFAELLPHGRLLETRPCSFSRTRAPLFYWTNRRSSPNRLRSLCMQPSTPEPGKGKETGCAS